jgi:hypothetical protein
MIDPRLTAFLQEGLGIYVGTRNAALEPNGARGLAVLVEDDGVHATVFVSKVAAPRLLADLEANGQIAVSVGRPRDDRACQVKGVYVSSRPARPRERAIIDQQWDGFMAGLEYIGFSRVIASGWAKWPAVAIRFKATAVFEQTPGPAAGEVLQ